MAGQQFTSSSQALQGLGPYTLQHVPIPYQPVSPAVPPSLVPPNYFQSLQASQAANLARLGGLNGLLANGPVTNYRFWPGGGGGGGTGGSSGGSGGGSSGGSAAGAS